MDNWTPATVAGIYVRLLPTPVVDMEPAIRLQDALVMQNTKEKTVLPRVHQIRPLHPPTGQAPKIPQIATPLVPRTKPAVQAQTQPR